MKLIIDEIAVTEEKVRELNPDSPYRGCALSALSSARDNLKWHGEWDAKRAEEKAKADEEALKNAQELIANVVHAEAAAAAEAPISLPAADPQA